MMQHKIILPFFYRRKTQSKTTYTPYMIKIKAPKK